MTWLVASLISAAFMGLVSISDKVVIHRYAKTPLTLPLISGTCQVLFGIACLFVAGIPGQSSFMANASAISSGMFLGLAVMILMRVMYTKEVSRAIPVTQCAPIFSALLALPILGESISLIQWLGIMAAVIGSVFISLKIGPDISGILLDTSFYWLMLSAFCFGAAYVVGKVALEELPILYTHGLRTFTLGSTFLIFTSRSVAWNDTKSLIKKRSPAFLFVGVNEFITAQFAIIILLWALSLGPASLVSAATSSRALFTLLFTLAITRLWNGALGEDTSTSSTLAKLFSTLLIVSGIFAIAI